MSDGLDRVAADRLLRRRRGAAEHRPAARPAPLAAVARARGDRRDRARDPVRDEHQRHVGARGHGEPAVRRRLVGYEMAVLVERCAERAHPDTRRRAPDRRSRGDMSPDNPADRWSRGDTRASSVRTCSRRAGRRRAGADASRSRPTVQPLTAERRRLAVGRGPSPAASSTLCQSPLSIAELAARLVAAAGRRSGARRRPGRDAVTVDRRTRSGRRRRTSRSSKGCSMASALFDRRSRWLGARRTSRSCRSR